MTQCISRKHRSEHLKLRQLSIFPEIVCSAYLVAESPKSAFYRIWIEADAGIYTVLKESGIKGRVLDKRPGRMKPWTRPGSYSTGKSSPRPIRSANPPENTQWSIIFELFSKNGIDSSNWGR
jgi:hypothetical protein